MLSTQIANVGIDVTCSDVRFLRALERYFNTADHWIDPVSRVAMTVEFDGVGYTLSPGRYELSPEVAARAAWTELDLRTQAALASSLQVSGLCIDADRARLLVLGETVSTLNMLALYALSKGLDVSSSAGVCLEDSIATPYAAFIEVPHSDLLRLKRATSLEPCAAKTYDEMGAVRYLMSPLHFGRKWIIRKAPIDRVIILRWNPGGWSGLGRRTCRWVQESILDNAHIPSTADMPAKLRLLAEARRLAASAPSIVSATLISYAARLDG